MATMVSAKTRLLVFIAVGLVAAGAIAWYLGHLVFDTQRSLTIAFLVTTATDTLDSSTDPRDVTSALCGAELNCVEAFDTDEATYYRFDSRESATQFESSLADGFRSNYIVMDFEGRTDVPKERQLWAMQILAGTWQDYEGTFPTR